jgi:hypothetical protein
VNQPLNGSFNTYKHGKKSDSRYSMRGGMIGQSYQMEIGGAIDEEDIMKKQSCKNMH